MALGLGVGLDDATMSTKGRLDSRVEACCCLRAGLAGKFRTSISYTMVEFSSSTVYLPQRRPKTNWLPQIGGGGGVHISNPKYYNPHGRNPQKGAPDIWKPPCDQKRHPGSHVSTDLTTGEWEGMGE